MPVPPAAEADDGATNVAGLKAFPDRELSQLVRLTGQVYVASVAESIASPDWHTLKLESWL